MRAIRIMVKPAIILCCYLCLLHSSCTSPVGPDDERPVEFKVHNGYNVKNTFVELGLTTCLVFVDKTSFDSILNWIADNNPYEPIPDADFQTRTFPVVIKKGNSYWTMAVESVGYVQSDKTLHVHFRATLVADNMSWIAVIPLILSVQNGDYSSVRFYENGKFIASVSTVR